MIDLEGYVILVVGTSDGSVRLFGESQASMKLC